MIRRTSWRHYRHDHAEVAARAAQWMAAELGWDDATTETEILNYRKQFGSNGAPPPPHEWQRQRTRESDWPARQPEANLENAESTQIKITKQYS